MGTMKFEKEGAGGIRKPRKKRWGQIFPGGSPPCTFLNGIALRERQIFCKYVYFMYVFGFQVKKSIYPKILFFKVYQCLDVGVGGCFSPDLNIVKLSKSVWKIGPRRTMMYLWFLIRRAHITMFPYNAFHDNCSIHTPTELTIM